MHLRRELHLDTCLLCAFAVGLSFFIGWFVWIRTGNAFTTMLSVLMILIFCSIAPSVKNIP